MEKKSNVDIIVYLTNKVGVFIRVAYYLIEKLKCLKHEKVRDMLQR